MNSCEKYWWITEHPEFINKDLATVDIEITPHMVCKETNRIEDYEKLNTTLQLWIEVMVPYYNSDEDKWEHSHHTELDCGGFTWEEAIDNLYELVLKEYGDYTEEDCKEKRNSLFRIQQATITAKSRKLKTTWSLGKRSPQRWGDRILSPEHIEIYKLDVQETLKTINALTNYRKTCSIEEYDEVDAELEKEKFILFECELSIQHNIDLVRR